MGTSTPQYSLQNEDKIDTNVSTFINYAQALRYMFRPFLGHHQATHKNINLSSSIELFKYGSIFYNLFLFY
jgi:hypothetical protein